jgi:hypothetical protein
MATTNDGRPVQGGPALPVYVVNSAADSVPTTGGGGGGGGGAVTIADGADVTLGAKADAAASTDVGTFSLISLFKRLLEKITAGLGVVPINSALFTGSAGVLNADILADTDAKLYRSVSIQLTGTWSATISPQVSVDGGTSWNNLVGINVQNNAQAINLTSNGIYAFSLPAGARFRLRATVYTSGTANGSVIFSSTPMAFPTVTMLPGNTIAVSATQLPAALGPQTPATSLSIARPAATATLQSAATATGNGTAWSVEGLEFATFHVGGITTATITWETLNDATSGWVALLLTNQTSGALSTTATADGIYAVNCAGLNQIRARISAYTSGTISVLGRGA